MNLEKESKWNGNIEGGKMAVLSVIQGKKFLVSNWGLGG